MFIKLKDFICSFRGSISVPGVDVTPKCHIISTNSTDIDTLYAIA